jgi:hypothetical protein
MPTTPKPRPSAIPLPLTSRLQADVLKTLLYFDIFNHPLTAEEINSFLPRNSTNPESIAHLCDSIPLSQIIKNNDGYFALRNNKESSVELRHAKEGRAKRLWTMAVVMGNVLRRIPFVRGVAISGELSKGVASEKGDIDFLVITAPGRLWISRTLAILFKKVFLLNRKKYFCVNHFVTENRMAYQERNIYAALEIATLKPVSNFDLFRRYRASNSWITDFLPNAPQVPSSPSYDNDVSYFQKTLEILFPPRMSGHLDRFLMNMWRKIWKRRYPQLSEKERNALYQCEPYISTAYGDDFLSKVLESYNRRLKSYGLQPVPLPNR